MTADRAFTRADGCRKRCGTQASSTRRWSPPTGTRSHFLRKGSREDLRQATGDTKLPALKRPDGTVITHSKKIMAWIDEQR
jgi:hypothetical protein